jgi:hypothetical protein
MALKPRSDVSDNNPPTSAEPVEFHYQVSWRTHGATPGHHYSTQFGGGFEFHGHAPLISHPDPRNLDIHASLHDPFGQFAVRTFRQRSSIPVFVVADLSASMNFIGTVSKPETRAWITACVAYSAFRTGDPFGFVACGETIDPKLLVPLRWYKGIAPELFNRLRNFSPAEQSANGLFQAAPFLGRRKALVFLVSDFHFSLATLSRLMQTLETHDVVPIVVWDSLEVPRPGHGFYRLMDPETGKSRLLLLRPGLTNKFRSKFEKRREFGREPFFVSDQFDPDRLTHYFLQ